MVSSNMKKSLFDYINLIFLFAVSITMVYPFIYLLVYSLSTVGEIPYSSLFPMTKTISFEAYKFVFNKTDIGGAFGVTFYITIAGTATNLFLTSLGGYILSIKELPGSRIILKFILFTMLFNGGLIPTYMVVVGTGLYNSLWSLIIPAAISTYWLFIAKNFFSTIPASLRESARIDGCTEFGILVRIMYPLSMPILATMALNFAVAHWNQYFMAILYITDPKKMPIQVIIRRMYESATSMMETDNIILLPLANLRSATIIIATVPIICIYPFLQKYFIKGMLLGSIKG